MTTTNNTPETFTGPDGREYFRHDGGKMPCDPKALVHVILKGGAISQKQHCAEEWIWDCPDGPGAIIGYRHPDEQPAKIPDPWQDEREALHKLLADLLEEYDCQQSQFGSEYLWQKHENKEVVEAARKALNPHHKTPQKSA